jgi:hypothetical protein
MGETGAPAAGRWRERSYSLTAECEKLDQVGSMR